MIRPPMARSDTALICGRNRLERNKADPDFKRRKHAASNAKSTDIGPRSIKTVGHPMNWGRKNCDRSAGRPGPQRVETTMRLRRLKAGGVFGVAAGRDVPRS